MNKYIAQLQSAVRATTILSPTTFAWFGVPSARILPRVLKSFTAQTARDYLLFNLQNRLYDDFYGQGTATLVNSVVSGGRADAFKDSLERVNKGTGSWEPGWKGYPVEGGHMLVERGGLTLTVADEEYWAAEEPVQAGASVEVRFGKDLPVISPGFYMALGNNALTAEDERDLVRLYWHMGAQGAVPLMQAVTEVLNEAEIRFKLKIKDNPQGFNRCDTAILYLPGKDFARAAHIVSEVYGVVGGFIKEEVPALTLQLAPGLALAEDPKGQSFGLQRSMLIAQGLANAYDEGAKHADDRLGFVLERFRQVGIDPEKPYLEPGSERSYEMQLEHHPVHKPEDENSKVAAHGSEVEIREDDYLRAAEEIGKRIVRDAIWHSEQCNWIGALSAGTTGVPVGGAACRALGPDFYAGTSGIGVFLAELYNVTGEQRLRHTAVGAVYQALATVERLPAEERLAFYTGGLGVVLAAVRTAYLLGEERLEDLARERLDSLLEQYIREGLGMGHDYLSGRAGAIVALLRLRELWGEGGDSRLTDIAVRLGDDLVEAAHKSERGYSWGTNPGQKHRNLTGLSHGAAGIGLALAELYMSIKEARYRDAAEQAFLYERSWFDPEQGNWPDFRFDTNYGAKSKGAPLAYRTFWCHGAPGIALSRLRACSILKESVYLEEARIALETTRKAVETATEGVMHDFSLCHGVAGNCEVLLEGIQHVPHVEYRDAVLRAAAKGIRRFGGKGHSSKGHSSWPCGTGGGYTPSLMLGSAGVGLFYLRLYKSEIASPLVG